MNTKCFRFSFKEGKNLCHLSLLLTVRPDALLLFCYKICFEEQKKKEEKARERKREKARERKRERCCDLASSEVKGRRGVRIPPEGSRC